MKEVTKIVIAAAGLGTRFTPTTHVIPKELFPLINKPVIHFVLEEALTPNIKEVVLVINNKKDSVVEYLKNHAGDLSDKLKKKTITVVYQDMSKYGDAIPILNARKHLENSVFLVLWSDFFSLKKYKRISNLYDIYKKYQKPVASFIPITAKQTSASAAVPRIKRVNGNLITFDAITKNPGPIHATSLLTAPSGFIFNSEIFNYLDKIKPNKAGEFCIIDAIDDYSRNKLAYGVIFKKPYFETGNPTDFIKSILKLTFYEEDFRENKIQIQKFVKSFYRK